MLSPSPVILSEAKNLIPLLRVNSAKHLCRTVAGTLHSVQGDTYDSRPQRKMHPYLPSRLHERMRHATILYAHTSGLSRVSESMIKALHVMPVTLTGRWVRLEALSETHVAGLFAAGGQDGEIWRYMLDGPMRSEVEMLAYVRGALQRQEGGAELPFCVVDQASGQAAGATRYLNISPMDGALEIGGTWYAKAFQRTPTNTECKYLLLGHAFETLGCVRVQLKTDARNLRSQAALERLGAVREGVLRKHMRLPDGYQRDSVMYSITDDEWPAVKARLESFLDSR